MQIFTHLDKPLKVFGVPFFEQKKNLQRLPDELIAALPEGYKRLGKRCPGTRVGFRTNAEEFTVEITLDTLSVDIGMAIYSCQSAEVHIGPRGKARYVGLVNPSTYDTKTFSRTFRKSGATEDVMIYLPRNEMVLEVKVTLPDGATVEEPTSYKYGPVVFYGSSITEGGCCTRMTNAYNAMLSDRLDFDYYNFGFSGSAKGELCMADHINTIDMKAFVYDYDHNAPSADHLRATHEAFFKRIREKNPTLPVLMMTKPDFDYDTHAAERREVVYSTYKNAVDNGDENVYFLDGETFFGTEDRELCTVDCCHPNDLGFYRMAAVVEPVIKKMLGIE